MRSTQTRILCALLALVLLSGLLSLGTSDVSAAYENTYKNTGNQRSDLIGVALTQVGYREGSNNYTKYGVWYGSSNMAWCGAFISWCANQAGIPTSVLRKNGFASLSSFGITDTFKYSSGRTPRPGDIYMKNDGSHVGIVYYVEGNYFYTIEGNTSTGTSSTPNSVAIKRKALTGSYTFGSPRYTSDGGHNYKSYYESAHPHREYMYCDHCNDYYYTGKTSTNSNCTTCIQASCSHSYSAWTKLNDNSHQRTCSKCGKVETKSHSWNSGTVTKAATCKETGTKTQTCKTCNATRTVTIAKLTTHTYGAWQYMDEEKHFRECTVCGKHDVQSHTQGDTWETDLFYHWYTCTACEGKAGLHEHVFGDGCEEPCDVCQYHRQTGHIFSAELSYDESGHWHACENCAEKGSFVPHEFSSDCDETCEHCGYVRQTQHVYSGELMCDETGHYHVCQICGQKQPSVPHDPGPEATEESAQYCNVCGYELAPRLEHVHDFSSMSCDSTSHWGHCRCGEEYPREDHIWDVNTGLCKVCGIKLQTQPQPKQGYVFEPFHLIPLIAVLLLIAIFLLVKIIRRTRKKKKIPAAVS